MPPQITWIERVPDIIAHLRASTVPVLDRRSVEKLFGLRKRQALRLMVSVGGYEAGNASLVRRRGLIEYLDSGKMKLLQKGKRERIGQVVDDSWKPEPPKPVIVPRLHSGSQSLPLGIDIEVRRGANEARISFYDLNDLHEKLYSLLLFLNENDGFIEKPQLESREKAYYSADWEPGRDL
jgi:hypothetical protein